MFASHAICRTPARGGLVAIVGITFLTVSLVSSSAHCANYKEMMTAGTNKQALRKLYEVYASKVIGHAGSQSHVIERLAGSPDFCESFLLACLSNGWPVRAMDVSHEYLPLTGAWAFSRKNYQGLLRQFPSNCEDMHCLDIASFDGFHVQSLMIGNNVKGQLFAKPNFEGKTIAVDGSQSALGINCGSLKLRLPPRIDFVTISDYEQNGKTASFRIHVSGANIGDDAELFVGGVQVDGATVDFRLDNSRWLGLGQDLAQAGYDLDPTYFEYPIYHYDSISGAVEAVDVDSKQDIRLRNQDGQASNQLSYLVPTTDTLDSDGDGLLDDWELNGIDDLNLPALGANPYRKDLYLEVDHMMVPGRVWSDFCEEDYPRRETFEATEKMFAEAPVINPDGSVGIALHVDHGQEQFEESGHGEGGTIIPWKRYIGFKSAKDSGVDEDQRDDYCNANEIRQNEEFFSKARRRVFRYCIFADQQWGSRSTGAANAKTIFFLSLGVCRMNAVDRNYQTGVFTHELGHLLSLEHGGDQNDWFNYKPNFNSLMNYQFTFTGHDSDGKLGGFETKPVGDQVYSFSEGMRASLDEATLYEALGTANHYPHDWNKNGVIDSRPVRVVLRNPEWTGTRVLRDCSDWARMKFYTLPDEKKGNKAR